MPSELFTYYAYYYQWLQCFKPYLALTVLGHFKAIIPALPIRTV